MITCNVCRGSGKCPQCDGEGKVTIGFFSKTEENCHKCGGLGKCTVCNGKGVFTTQYRDKLKIRCPKCGSITEVISKGEPFQKRCECGTMLIIRK
jgi:phage FluMu protein Com